MPTTEGLEITFNTVYFEYDKWRPTYPKELYNEIFNIKEINPLSNILEIGIGTGQATLPLLETGCSLTAIELGDQLAEYSKEKFKNYEQFKVKNIAFQNFECPSNSFDLIFSATAFHWIPEEIGYTKVFDLLKSGGIFARFANHPYKDKKCNEIHDAFQKIYAKYMPGSLAGDEYSEENAKNIANIACKYGFTDISYKLYHRTRTFTANDYTMLLGTYSDHIAIEETTRKKFFAEIRQAIDDNGGIITLYDTIDLQIARKP
ncbi:methyltransferase domain-containing protein [Anaerocolumna sedimenticola]|uniref:Methyltransferase domain-containing protein n=1 Tax=Anaerocolumna sedimenticola TaxID=2696063 RepID=A0A6P1TTC3_9FIRM|nr:class I SAM-dependent methyltransferase [Anaerocolumna sedimenticola]QHQ62966.1 methyltransferase domain-containing protein [Anaerocolumna sedimenticola]